MATDDPHSESNFLTHKLGPFPVWVWGLLALGAYLLFFKKGASTSSSTGAVATGMPQTETMTYPTGSSYSGPVGYAPTAQGGGGGGGSPAPSPGNAGATPGGGNTALAGGTVVGGGTLFPMGSGYSVKGTTGKLKTGAVVGYTGGTYTTVKSYGTNLKYLNAGTPVYYQSAPGQFQEVTSATQLSQIEPAGAKGGSTDTTTYTKG